MNKKILRSALAVCMAAAVTVSLAACGGSGSSSSSGGEQTFNLKLSHGLAEDHAVHIQMQSFAEAVNEKSGGTISIELFANGTLGSESDNLTQIQAGSLDMAKVSASTLVNYDSAALWNAVCVPYVFNDQDHYYKVMDSEIADKLYETTVADGFQGLFWLDSGARSFYTANTPIYSPSDLKGLKIRTMDSQMSIDMMTALGGSSTILGYSDIYTAMQNGTIDGAENNVTAMRDHADVTGYYCYDEHTRIPDVVVISTSVWNSMTEEQQQIMTECAKEASNEYKTAWKNFEDEVVANFSDQVEFITADQVDTAAFQEACQSIYDGLQADSPEIYEVVEEIKAMAD